MVVIIPFDWGNPKMHHTWLECDDFLFVSLNLKIYRQGGKGIGPTQIKSSSDSKASINKSYESKVKQLDTYS